VNGADWVQAVDSALGFLGADLRREVSLAPMSTYRVGGAARRYVEIDSDDQLSAVVAALAGIDLGNRALVIGRGSNLLVAQSGFEGVALRLGEAFCAIDVDGVTVRVGAAASLPVVARRTVAAGLTGFEWAVGVPGSIGGATVMNAGGHGSDMSECVQGVRVHDLRTGETRIMSTEQLEFSYRSSALESHHVVSRVDLSLEPGDIDRGNESISAIVRWRRENQPGGQNAGSVFTNPPDDSAGRLIEAAGCKGLRMGTAEVSRKHANFIQADPGGSADDVRALMDEVAQRVEGHSGVVLHPETVMVGFTSDPIGGPR
jgi:UDP-N-acetylmuramate dehydrogenase